MNTLSIQYRSVGEFIKASRKMLNLSQSQLAEATGNVRQTIAQIENGDTNPRFLKAQTILSYLKSKGAPDYDLYMKHIEADEFGKDREQDEIPEPKVADESFSTQPL